MQFTKNLLFVDIETRAMVPLKETSVQHYAPHKDTSIICLVAIDLVTKKVYEIDLYTQTPKAKALAKAQLKELSKLKRTLVAHNYGFELELLTHKLVSKKLLPKFWSNLLSWLCTYNMALACGFSALGASLVQVGDYLNTSDKKDSVGQDLINKYSKPKFNRKTGLYHLVPIPPKDLKDFIKYCKQDVKTTVAIFKRMAKVFNGNFEHDVYNLYQTINHRGVKVDTKAAKIISKATGEALGKIEKASEKNFGLAKSGGLLVNSPTALKDLLNKNIPKALQIDNAQAATLEHLAGELEKLNTPKAKKMLTAIYARQNLSSQALKKIDRLSVFDLENNVLGLCDAKGISKDFLQYHKAGTGRGAGRNIQVHNMYSGCVEHFSKTLQGLKKLSATDLVNTAKKMSRQLIIPHDKTKEFYIADLKSIEARVAFWLIGADKLLKIFADFDKGEGYDPYVVKAAEVFKCSLSQVTDQMREVGKVLVLSANYGLSGGALHWRLKADGLNFVNKVKINYISQGKAQVKTVDLSDDDDLGGLRLHNESLKYIKASNTLVLGFKKGIEVFSQTKEVKFRSPVEGLKISQTFEAGQFIADYREGLPELKEAWYRLGRAFKDAYSHDSGIHFCTFKYTSIGFESFEEYFTMVLPSGRRLYFWKKLISLDQYYSTRVFQNIIQSIARDVMVVAALKVEAHKDFIYSFDVHDEVIAEGPKGSKKHLQEFLEILESPLPWGKGLIIKAEGDRSPRYTKI